MKKEFKTLNLKKITIAKMNTSELMKIQGGSSDPTDPDPHADPELSRQNGCTYSLFQ
ncbi:class I lanthipeptide [Dokdonia pacifica]|nr:class I lanthipeptide [Dokdonia pacifica]